MPTLAADLANPYRLALMLWLVTTVWREMQAESKTTSKRSLELVVGISEDALAGQNVDRGDRVGSIVEERFMAPVLMLQSWLLGTREEMTLQMMGKDLWEEDIREGTSGSGDIRERYSDL